MTKNCSRLDASPERQPATKAWISNTTTDGTDQFQALRRLPHGGTLMVQDRDNHNDAVLFIITGPLIDKGAYVEVPVLFLEGQGVLASAQCLVAVFNPGPLLSLTPSAPVHEQYDTYRHG